MAEYNGPGEYAVRVHFGGSTIVRVQAMNRDEAFQKAEDEADEFDVDFDCEADDILSVTPLVGEDLDDVAGVGWRDHLNGVEEAAWALTGNVPPEAFQRLSEQSALQLEEAARV